MQKEDCDHLSKQILTITGKPRYYHSTKCTKISNNSYRINVFTSEPSGAIPLIDIVSSYFVTIDDDMNIINSDPELKKL